MERRHNPVHCILPPHMLRELAKRGSSQQRDIALHTLATDQTQRVERLTLLLTRVARPHTLVPSTPSKRRTVYDARGSDRLPGKVVRQEGDKATGDKAIDEAYAGLGATFDFFAQVLQRDSIDDEGMPLLATVHYGKSYDNAFWNGEQMVFGDGDGELFNRFTIALDIIGHELTHGVVGDEAKLHYVGQSGALNESVSDVFGVLVKQRKKKHTVKQADWLIGKGLFTKKVRGEALRSMKEPGTAYDDPLLGKDPQPSHMDDYVETSEDNGGVHINSGIPNRAFFVLATNLGGYAWERAGRIWYETLRDRSLRPNASFRTFATRTALNASHIYGIKSTERKAVLDAWASVGVVVR
jgi:Zn-dependent metalloprotease